MMRLFLVVSSKSQYKSSLSLYLSLYSIKQYFQCILGASFKLIPAYIKALSKISEFGGYGHTDMNINHWDIQLILCIIYIHS